MIRAGFRIFLILILLAVPVICRGQAAEEQMAAEILLGPPCRTMSSQALSYYAAK